MTSNLGHGRGDGERDEAVDIDLTGPTPAIGLDASSTVVIPHVVGHHIDIALRRLDDLGLVVRVVTTEVHDKSDRHVVATHPPAGTVVKRPVVEIVVGIAPAVADYTGRDLDDAVRLAELAGHVVETVGADPGTVRSATDVVVAQEPEPDERSRVVLFRFASA